MRRDRSPRLLSLGFLKLKFSVDALERAVYLNLRLLQVYVRPAKSTDLAAAKAQRQGDGVESFQALALCGFKQ
jgi:hypothetical protein